MKSIVSKKVLTLAFLGLVLIALVGVGGTGWYYSNLIKDGALVVDHAPTEHDLEIVAVDASRMTLQITPKAKVDGNWTKDGIWGVEWNGGYAQVGAILEIDDQQVVRRLLSNAQLPEVGQMVHLDSFAFTGDPQTALGIPFTEVAFSSPLGEFPAWFIEGPGSTWAIFVHGKGANREEALRMLPTVVERGLPSLVITYRNDAEAPVAPRGLHQFGETEWHDLEAAVSYALEQGAEGVILVGYSMGGGIVMNFLYRSPLADRARGAILDSPVLSFDEIVNYGARRRGVPGPLTYLGKAIAGLRFGIDWEARDYLARTDELTVPVLLFHGDADNRVAVESSDALAEARPDIVTYVRVAGATHVRSWNMDPSAYEQAVRSFLEGLPSVE